MTTPEQIIAKIEEIEKEIDRHHIPMKIVLKLLKLKQMLIAHFNLPTADSPEGSPGQEDVKQ